MLKKIVHTNLVLIIAKLLDALYGLWTITGTFPDYLHVQSKYVALVPYNWFFERATLESPFENTILCNGLGFALWDLPITFFSFLVITELDRVNLGQKSEDFLCGWNTISYFVLVIAQYIKLCIPFFWSWQKSNMKYLNYQIPIKAYINVVK